MKIIAFICLLILIPMKIIGSDYYKYLSNAQSLNGITGNITTPSTHVTSKDNFSFGIHKFIIGANYGINGTGEVGLNIDLKKFSTPSVENQEQQITITSGEQQKVILHTKYVPVDSQLNRSYSIALGLYSGLYCEENTETQTLYSTIYIVMEKRLYLKPSTFIQFGSDYSKNKIRYFITFLQSTGDYSMFICEYKSRTGQANFGWRVLLSPHIKLDIFLLSTGNLVKDWFSTFIFGLTMSTNYNAG